MDRNSITGVILIVLIVVGYNALFPPVIEVEAETSDTNNTTVIVEEEATVNEETNTSIVSDTTELNDLHQRTYGVFAPSAQGSDEDILIENDVLKLSISPKGAPSFPNPPCKSKFDFKSFNPIILLFCYTYVFK